MKNKKMEEGVKSPDFDDNWPLFEKVLAYLRYLQIRKYIVGEPKYKCVDIGCGFNGRFLFSIADRIKCGYGFDLRANEIEKGNIKLVNNSKFDGKIPLKDETVDRVFMLAVLEHLPVENGLVKESIRILKKDGLLVLTTPTPMAKPVLEFLSYKLHIISEESIREHQHYYSKQELIGRLKQEGFQVDKYTYFQFGFNQMIIGRK
ncbi:MAG: class I SAM-dependent methyltransferase [Lachnospiraceae bacterium]